MIRINRLGLSAGLIQTVGGCDYFERRPGGWTVDAAGL